MKTVKIPVDKEAALKIFGDDNEDFELDFAMKYFDKICGKEQSYYLTATG